MNEAVEDLQMRFAHQEVALEALNDTVVRQARMIDALRSELDQVKRDLRELRPSPLSGVADEPPPPHY
ncbi:MAG: SlyX family protein [Gammaproteobacteria bacterium]|nr:SlyX family protein [Gammaproteobacteria bacterium]MCB1924228.1 SlyX family protein [Gammaproteobacteria bacterium]